ncbi:VOC family protein [Eubacteriales bacterium OttesenSCG-928-N13]|nr:VOC family protein [Eubacteriales bacterium OttesenSCG-928-N13]
MGVIDPNKVCQIALVVDDIERVAQNYAELFGVPVPNIWELPPQSEAHTRYHGEPCHSHAKLCVFDMGQVVLELTQPDELPSSWKQYQDEHGQGVHHIGFQVKDRDQVMQFFAEKNAPERLYGEYTGGNYTFVDSEREFGVLINVKYEEGQQ